MNFVRVLAGALLVMCAVGVARADVFTLKDGQQVEGSVLRTSADGRVTIKTSKGISTFGVLEFSEDTQIEHFEELAESILLKIEAASEGQADADSPVKSSSTEAADKTLPTTSKSKAPAAIAMMGAGVVLMVIGGVWFIIAGFSVSPMWGIALLLFNSLPGFVFFTVLRGPGVFFCNGVAGLAFLVLHWNEAKNPFYASVLGLGLIILAPFLF